VVNKVSLECFCFSRELLKFPLTFLIPPTALRLSSLHHRRNIISVLATSLSNSTARSTYSLSQNMLLLLPVINGTSSHKAESYVLQKDGTNIYVYKILILCLSTAIQSSNFYSIIRFASHRKTLKYYQLIFSSLMHSQTCKPVLHLIKHQGMKRHVGVRIELYK
jgi:hypothetical protein